MRIFFRVSLLTGLCLSACAKKEAPSQPQIEEGQSRFHIVDGTPVPAESKGADSRQARPRFYYDLGPASVEVSAYPREQQENYKLFLAVCSACHSAARPLNAPYAERAVWKRFVSRMHVKMEGEGVHLAPGAEERIVDFLVYDSKIRKIDRKEEFQSQQDRLRKMFKE